MRIITLFIVLLFQGCASSDATSIDGAFQSDVYGIIDYHPSEFVELADKPFFYSIGKELRYGLTINEDSPVIFKGKYFFGEIVAVYPSPDNKKAAVVSGGNIYIVASSEKPILLLEKVTHFGDSKGEGDFFYPTLRWNASSSSIYIVKDHNNGPQPYDIRDVGTELIRVDINLPAETVVEIKDFRARSYFLVGNDSICFFYPPGDGTLIWKCLHQGQVSNLKSSNNDSITLENGESIKGKPFVSYRGSTYLSDVWLASNGFTSKRNSNRTTSFFSEQYPKAIFTIVGKIGFMKGRYLDGLGNRNNGVLPGGRYALLDVYHDNFEGQLLIDGVTGNYRELPSKTKVYTNINSLNYSYFELDLTVGGEHFVREHKFSR